MQLDTTGLYLELKHAQRTFSGIYIDLANPDVSMIAIEDIAHSLSQAPRWAGHLPELYSVAQHCIACSRMAKPEHKLSALLHDASEAYLCDVSSPFKTMLNNYKEIEHKIMSVIAQKLGIGWPMPTAVKEIDNYMLEWEWHSMVLKHEHVIQYPSWLAEKIFLQTFKMLTK